MLIPNQDSFLVARIGLGASPFLQKVNIVAAASSSRNEIFTGTLGHRIDILDCISAVLLQVHHVQPLSASTFFLYIRLLTIGH
jgi:hypothetical protein